MAKKIKRTAAAPEQSAGGAKGGGQAREKRKRGRVAPQIVNDFTIQLATLSEAGIPVVKALTILEGQTRPGPFKYVLQDVVDDVSGGTPLSEALAKHDPVFDSLYSSMVRAGEAGGILDTVLTRLATFREKAAAIKATVRGAMIYPAVILTVAVGVIAAVITWVIPKFREIFDSFGVDLPGSTQTLLSISDACVNYWYLVFGLPIVFVLLHLTAMRRGGAYRFKMHGLLLKIPGLGPVLSHSIVAGFARTFGTLIQAGVPHLDGLSIVRDTTANDVLADAIEDIRRVVREGDGLARPMGETGLFDDLVVNMVDVGEETGELDRMLLKVADAYEVQVDRTIDSFFKLLEPALLIMIAGVVGFIVVALFMPLMEIMSQLGSA
ncbi:MAG: type II secretion system F family protein [Planctomycetes bacterium]|nr:type II secretion system F family protein [Planctomycetota bacterium]